MKYTVIKYFTDLQDKNHVYRAGDTYPREGYIPSESRIIELASGKNKQHTPLIQAIPETVEAAAPAEDSTEEKPKRRKKRND